jgi:hypothetical protein
MRRALLLPLVVLLAGCGGAVPAGEGQPVVSFAGFSQDAGLLPHSCILRICHPHVRGFGSVASPFVGEVFHATSGKWRNNPSSYAYQWERCTSGTCSGISGATTSSYTVATADEGHKLRVTVTATNGFGSATAHSAETGEVPAAPGDPCAECLHVAQTGKGAETGSECATAKPVSYLSETGGGNWGAGKLVAGKGAELCGTITEQVTVHSAGTSGSPIGVYFAAGAKISKPHCPTQGEGGCLNTNGEEYLTIDGGTNGVIEATESGSAYTEYNKEWETDGINAKTTNHLTIEHLSILNMFIKATYAFNKNNPQGENAIVLSGSNDTVDNVTMKEAGWAFLTPFEGTNTEDNFYSNTIESVAHGWIPGPNCECSLGRIYFHNNHILNEGKWDTPEHNFHLAAIHCYTGNNHDEGAKYEGLYIYDNTIGGTQRSPEASGEDGSFDADMFIEGGKGIGGDTPCAAYTSPIYIFNNVFQVGKETTLGNGIVSVNSGKPYIFNNTFLGPGSEPGGTGCLKDNNSGFTSLALEKNNLISNCPVLIESHYEAHETEPNYQLYGKYYASDPFVCWNASKTKEEFFTTAAYGTCIKGEANSKLVSNAKVIESESAGEQGKPESGSEAIGNGANLKTTCELMTSAAETACKANIAGEARSASGAWNIGAY